MGTMRNAASEGRRRNANRPTSTTATSTSTNSSSTATATATTETNEEQMFGSFIMQFNGMGQAGAAGFEAIANNINAHAQAAVQTVNTGRGHGHGGSRPNLLRNKIVFELSCRGCATRVCNRAMKAILLADTKIELYSTDIPPTPVHLLDEDRLTQGCHCRIRDTACLGCGNVLGYHVSQPCERCLEAKNNGHFWMFYSDTIWARERMDLSQSGKAICWGDLTQNVEMDPTKMLDSIRYDLYCR